MTVCIVHGKIVKQKLDTSLMRFLATDRAETWSVLRFL